MDQDPWEVAYVTIVSVKEVILMLLLSHRITIHVDGIFITQVTPFLSRNSSQDLSELFAKKAGHKYRAAFCSEISEEQLEFKAMANEFRLTMEQPNSALRLFLRQV